MSTFPWNDYVFLVVAHALAVMSPGPDFAVVMKVATEDNSKRSLLVATGIAVGIGFHLAYCWAGLAVVASQSNALMVLLQGLGAAYLFWLGLGAVKSSLKNKDEEPHATPLFMRHSSAFWLGFITNVLNVKASLFFVSLFSQFVVWNSHPLTPYVYALSLIGVTWIWFVALGLSLSKLLRKARIQKAIGVCAGVVLIALSFYGIAEVAQKFL
jgi:threonine/homoserine/homoserine lactone efflux protein